MSSDRSPQRQADVWTNLRAAEFALLSAATELQREEEATLARFRESLHSSDSMVPILALPYMDAKFTSSPSMTWWRSP